MSKVFHFHCECKTVKLASRALYSGLHIFSGLFRVFWCTKVKEARLERSACSRYWIVKSFSPLLMK